MRRLRCSIALMLTVALLLSVSGCTLPGQSKNKSAALFPAYINKDGSERWGYIDAKGKFVIEPTYDWTGDFGADGLAVIEQAGRYGVIDKSGKVTVTPAYEYIERARTGNALIAREGSKYKVLSGDNNAWIESLEPINDFSDGLSPFARAAGDGFRWGYVKEDGTVAIEPQYSQASAFSGGKAVVGLSDGQYAVIDSAGKQLATLDCQWAGYIGDGLIAFSDAETHLYGYASTDGTIVIPAQFSGASPFIDGYAAVEVRPNPDAYNPRAGLIDKQGRFVIAAQYSSLVPIGGGLYAAGQPSDEYIQEPFALKKLVDRTGKELTGYMFYDVGELKDGLVSVTDLTSTFLIDATGAKAAGWPTVPGIGELAVVGGLVQAQIDGQRMYLDKDGTVWTPDATQTLAGDLAVRTVKYRPNRWILVNYPQVAGLDKRVEESLNAQLLSIFVDDERGNGGEPGADGYLETVTVGFAVKRLGNLLIVHLDGYVYPMGAAHGMPLSSDYHFDLTDGKHYILSDLFRADSRFAERLQTLIKQQMAAATEPYWFDGAEPTIRPDHSFTVAAEGLVVYFSPYEIAPYAAGFPTFTIPWAEIQNIIDTEGAFWKSFH